MIRQSIGKLNGKETFFCQCVSIDEAKEQKLPEGSYFFWEQEGERIYSPGEIVRQVQQSVVSGKFEPAQLLNHQTVKVFYDKVVSTQRESILEQFRATRQKFADNPMYPKSAVETIDSTIKFWEEKMVMPTMEGTVPGAQNAIRGDSR